MKVTSIFEDKSGNLWFGSNGYGVNRNIMVTLLSTLLKKEGLSYDVSTLEDSSGNLWFGCMWGGRI
jgi:ligand-binding sensor domain-containing protein